MPYNQDIPKVAAIVVYLILVIVGNILLLSSIFHSGVRIENAFQTGKTNFKIIFLSIFHFVF